MNYTKLLALAAMSFVMLSIPAKAQNDLSNMGVSFENKPAGTQTYTLWNGNYDKTNLQIGAGYVNKSWRCTYEGQGTQREDFFGDPDTKFFHGFQIGALYTPSFDWGLGLRTGLFLEFYSSRSQYIRDWCSHFSEADMYIPLHASYRIPFEQECCLDIFGGMGFQWAMNGRYYRQVGTSWKWGRRPVPIYEGYNQRYGNGWPQKVNWQAELGLNFRFQYFALSFTYSFGVVEHGIENTFNGGLSYITATKSRQDKMQATVYVAF